MTVAHTLASTIVYTNYYWIHIWNVWRLHHLLMAT